MKVREGNMIERGWRKKECERIDSKEVKQIISNKLMRKAALRKLQRPQKEQK